MVQSLNSAFAAKLVQSGVKPIWLVSITRGSTTWKWVSHGQSAGGLAYHASIADYSHMGSGLDPFTRSITAGQASITFRNDNTLRRIVGAGSNYLRGAKINVKMGFPGVGEAYYADRFTGTIDTLIAQEGSIVVHAIDALAFELDAAITCDFIAADPMTIISSMLTTAYVPAGLIGTLTLPSRIAAWRYTRTSYTGLSGNNPLPSPSAVTAPTAVRSLIEDLMFLVNGTLWADESGVIQYKDTGGSSVRTLTNKDILSFEVKDDSTNAKNDIQITAMADPNRIDRFKSISTVGGGGGLGWNTPGVLAGAGSGQVSGHFDQTGVKAQITWRTQDATAQGAAAWPGSSKRILSAQQSTDWINAQSCIDDIINNSSTVVKVNNAHVFGFTGGNGSGVGTGVNSAYLLVNSEVIQCTAAADAGRGSIVVNGNSYLQRTNYTIFARGLFGTTQVDHASQSVVYDITQLVTVAANRLQRFAYGAPVVEVDVPIRHLDLQIGDIISVVDDVFLSWGFDGSTTSITWEIIGKDEPIWDDNPSIKLTLCALSMSRASSPSNDFQIPGMVGNVSASLATLQYYGQVYTVSGGTWQTTSGLVGKVLGGTHADNGNIYQLKDSAPITLPDNSTTSIGYSRTAAGYTVLAPGIVGDYPPDQYPLCQITTLSGAVSSVIDLRNLFPFKGDGQIKPPLRLPIIGSDPGFASGMGYLYTKQISSHDELFYMNDIGTVVQLTRQGATVGKPLALPVLGSDPAPVSGFVQLYAKSYGGTTRMYSINDAGYVESISEPQSFFDFGGNPAAETSHGMMFAKSVGAPAHIQPYWIDEAGNVTAMLGGGGGVTSVAGKTGVVTLDHTTDLANVGTNTHATIDTFIASKAAASGLASLDASSLVVQSIQKIHETGGPTDLTAGAVADGSLFKRSGTTYVGIAIGGNNGIAQLDGNGQIPANELGNANDLLREGTGSAGSYGAMAGAAPDEIVLATSITSTGNVTPKVAAGAGIYQVIKATGTISVGAGFSINADAAGAPGTAGAAIGANATAPTTSAVLSTQGAITGAAGATFASGAGHAGNPGTNGSSPNANMGGLGGGGGSGGNGAATASSAGAGGGQNSSTRSRVAPLIDYLPETLAQSTSGNCVASGGSGGGGGTTGGSSGGSGGTGGGGGTAGATLHLTGETLTLGAGSTVSANGQSGGAGTTPGNGGTNTGAGGGGGGGGGGAGGMVSCYFHSFSGSVSANGGTGHAGTNGGSAGTGTSGAGGKGGDATNGAAGEAYNVLF